MHRSIWLLAAVLICGCRPAAVEDKRALPDNVLARVGSEVITVADFEEAMRVRPVGNDPAARAALLNELIEFRILVQEAKTRGYDRDPQMQHAYERLLANKVRAELETTHAPSEITTEEIERYYHEHEKDFVVPAKVRLAMIFVEAPSSFTEEKRAERRARIEEAQHKAQSDDFARLTPAYSYDQASKYKGGDLGYFVEGLTGNDPDAMESAALAAGFALKDPGQISEVVETTKGYYLLKLLERQPASTRPLASARPEIIARLRRERASRREGNLAAPLLATRKVEINRDRLASIPDPAAGQAPKREASASSPPPLPQP